MSKRKALIIGISGQDGSYLAEFLLEKDYRVFGLVRRNSVSEHQDTRIKKLVDDGLVETLYGDVLDPHSLQKALRLSSPDEVYNLAAQSHVRISFDIPQFTFQVNALGVVNILEAIKEYSVFTRFYQASSSEMFGNEHEVDWTQNENTRMEPTSPYGVAKLSAYKMVRHYRRAYGLFDCNGILFNHTSTRRGSNFVESKIVKGAVEIKKGLSNSLVLGNLDSERDWGASKDYVRAMWMILNHTVPDDFVIATGVTRSIRKVCEYVFGKLELDYCAYVKQDRKFIRPEELTFLRGDYSKAKKVLGWESQITFEEVLDEMIEFWMKYYEIR